MSVSVCRVSEFSYSVVKYFECENIEILNLCIAILYIYVSRFVIHSGSFECEYMSVYIKIRKICIQILHICKYFESLHL